MLKLVVLGLVATVASAGTFHPVNHEIVEQIKAKATTWTPMEVEQNPLFNMSAEAVHGLLGTTRRGPLGYNKPNAIVGDVPQNFDARTQWGTCIHPIRNQE
jgi:hypothetical protein